MKIKMSLPRTKMLDEAKNSKSYFVIIEILIFLALFVVGSILEGLVLAVPQTSYLLNSPEYQQVISDYSSGAITMDEMTQQVTDISTNLPESLIVLSLFITAIATIITMIYCRFFEKRKLSTMGFRKKNALAEYLVGVLVGTVIFSVAVGICLVTGSFRFDGVSENISWGYIGLFLLGFLVQGMSEEVLLRGYFTVSLQRRIPLVAAVAVSSVAFACLHLMNSGITVLAFINLTLFGVFASVYMIKRGNIWGVCAIHSLWNFVQGNIYGINVSGMGNMSTVLRMTPIESKTIFNGGEFGLEGGLGVTIVCVVGIIVLLCTKTKESELSEELSKV